MKKKLLIFTVSFFIASFFAMTYGQGISGTVTDQNSLPLPGVNVLIKGTTTGTQTDFDGNYSIEANASDVLVFSYIGQKTI